MTRIFSSPLVHTAYYSRELFSPANPQRLERVKALFLQEYGFGDRIPHVKDFAFNENVGCSNVANGIFMRLNACSLLKLRYWCLYPTQSTPKKIAQYIACMFLSPLAALVDLVMNATLLVFKLSAWPVLYIKMRNDDLAKKCLSKNVGWQVDAFFESFPKLQGAFFESIVCALWGPRGAISVDWCYPVSHYEGPDIPFIIPRTFLFGHEIPMTPEEQRGWYRQMSLHYDNWFQNGRKERILDPQKVRYLQEHCGWEHVSDQQFKDVNFKHEGFRDTKIAYRYDLIQQSFTLILDGEHRYITQHGTLETKHIKSFIQRLNFPVPPLLRGSLIPAGVAV